MDFSNSPIITDNGKLTVSNSLDISNIDVSNNIIVYGDFNQRHLATQPYKRYRITYFADVNDDVVGSSDEYYSIFKSKESWIQDFDNPTDSEWTADEALCPECYLREEVRSHIVDMEFIASGENGLRFNPPPRPDDDSFEDLFKIKTVDVRLTFR